LFKGKTARARNSGGRLSTNAVAAIAIADAAFCRANVTPPATPAIATIATAIETRVAVIHFIDMGLLLGDRRMVAQGGNAIPAAGDVAVLETPR
jgi:hypothetical protein